MLEQLKIANNLFSGPDDTSSSLLLIDETLGALSVGTESNRASRRNVILVLSSLANIGVVPQNCLGLPIVILSSHLPLIESNLFSSVGLVTSDSYSSLFRQRH